MKGAYIGTTKLINTSIKILQECHYFFGYFYFPKKSKIPLFLSPNLPCPMSLLLPWVVSTSEQFTQPFRIVVSTRA